ncbi:MAG: hypothetical protein N3I35_04665 [Clostridia bacterium]|nr:hypothetical protein [Clostridia bacterium]
MMLEYQIDENIDVTLAEKIKRELVSTLKIKGINIAGIQIEMNSGKINIEVFMGE